MDLVKEYRANAESARELAERTSDQGARRDRLIIADQWGKLADSRMEMRGLKQPSG